MSHPRKETNIDDSTNQEDEVEDDDVDAEESEDEEEQENGEDEENGDNGNLHVKFVKAGYFVVCIWQEHLCHNFKKIDALYIIFTVND